MNCSCQYFFQGCSVIHEINCAVIRPWIIFKATHFLHSILWCKLFVSVTHGPEAFVWYLSLLTSCLLPCSNLQQQNLSPLPSEFNLVQISFTFFFFFFCPAVGLDAAGKTTILYKLKLGEIVTTIPTIGKIFFNVHVILTYL